jgi:hypothetical protein
VGSTGTAISRGILSKKVDAALQSAKKSPIKHQNTPKLPIAKTKATRRIDGIYVGTISIDILKYTIVSIVYSIFSSDAA